MPSKLVDLFPQQINWDFTLPNATTSLGNEIRFPHVLPAVSDTKSRRTIIEVLAIEYDVGSAVVNTWGTSTTAATGTVIALSSRALLAAESAAIGGLPIGNINILDRLSLHAESEGTNAANRLMSTGQFKHSLISGGVGRLYPFDKLFFNINTGADLSSVVGGLRITYREHSVDFNEWWGVFLSYQQDPAP